jgi:DUF1365 family protein
MIKIYNTYGQVIGYIIPSEIEAENGEVINYD